MRSGFFICQIFGEGRGVRNVTTGTSHQAWRIIRQKDMCCQQHPVFPGGHPSKYWLGSTLLNFSDRTRTGVFSVIWPLATLLGKKVPATKPLQKSKWQMETKLARRDASFFLVNKQLTMCLTSVWSDYFSVNIWGTESHSFIHWYWRS